MFMSYVVDFKNIATTGLTSSPLAKELAGLRANEARYFMNKYQYAFTTLPVVEGAQTLSYVNRILQAERDLSFAAKPLEVAQFQVANMKVAYVFYEDGLSINVMYDVSDPKRRAVGIKLSQGMEIPKELVGKFKFARQKSKLAGEVRGSYFLIKHEY